MPTAAIVAFWLHGWGGREARDIAVTAGAGEGAWETEPALAGVSAGPGTGDWAGAEGGGSWSARPGAGRWS